MTNLDNTKSRDDGVVIAYARDADTGDIVYRLCDYRHGDGQLDSDANPIWLLGYDDLLAEAGIDYDDLQSVNAASTEEI